MTGSCSPTPTPGRTTGSPRCRMSSPRPRSGRRWPPTSRSRWPRSGWPDAEVHLRIAHRSYPAHAWATGLDATSDGGPGWREYLEQTYQHVWAKDFWAKEIYLGVRLGQRGVRAQLSGGVISQFRGVYARGEKALGLERRGGRLGRDRQVDGQRRAARPGAERQRAGRQARHLRRDRLAGPAHADADGGGAAAVRDQAQAVGRGGDRHPVRGADPQRADPAAPGAHVRRVVRRIPVVCPLSRCDVLSRRGAVAAFRRFAAVPGGDQLADEAHPAGQGEQGRQPPSRARARYGRAYPGGGRGGADRAGRADRRGQNARARHHQGTAAFRLRLAPADRGGPDQRPVRPPGGGGRRALPRYRHRRGRTPPGTSSRCCASRCPGSGSG